MEQLKTNILNLVSGEHESVYGLASQVFAGIESEGISTESKTANLLFQAIIRYADARRDADEALRRIIGTANSERTRLQTNGFLDLGWVSTNQFERSVSEMEKFKHEVHTVAYLAGLEGKQITELFAKICELIDFNK